MTQESDWLLWHEAYQKPSSALSQRLRLVQEHVGRFFDDRPDGELTVVSACAGQGHDIIGVLSHRADAARVRATLLEADARNVRAARARAREAGLSRVEVRHTDAGDLAAYEGAVPADLVLMIGVFGNVSDQDVRTTVRALPAMCRPGATVVWSRSRREPDLTGPIRTWFTESGFVEDAFHAPDETTFSVGVHRLELSSPSRSLRGRLFQFLG